MVALPALLLVVPFCFSGFFSSSSGEDMASPALRVSHASIGFGSLDPITIRGRRFQPGERVRITVHVGQQVARKTVGASRGTFTVTFGSLSPDRCSSTFAVARGNEGSRASVKRPLPACAPAGTP
jgi:hypothetical protein